MGYGPRKYPFDAQKIIDYWWEVKRSRKAVAKHFEVPQRAVDHWMVDIQRLGIAPRVVILQLIAKTRSSWDWPVDMSRYTDLTDPSSVAVLAKVVEPETETRDAVQERRDKNLITSLRSDLKDALERVAGAEDRLAAMDSLHKARVERTIWSPAVLGKGELSLTPMLFTSDFQCGEVVLPDEVDGINEFNKDIFCERYQLMIQKTIDLAEQNTGATHFPGLVYLRGGDAISGEIHEELAETNDLSAVPASRLVFQQEREGIERLKQKFGRVRVISLPGNHGRTTFKSHAKNYALRNFETLLSWWLADSFKDEPNVKFWTPMSADALFDVEGWKVLMSHGDRMGSRGGQGFVGPAATIARGHQKLYQNWTSTGQPVDMILTGHLHTSLKLERGYANGSLVGFGEFARDLRCLPAPAMQWLFFMHREQMVSHAFELQLSPKVKRSVLDTSNYEV